MAFCDCIREATMREGGDLCDFPNQSRFSPHRDPVAVCVESLDSQEQRCHNGWQRRQPYRPGRTAMHDYS